MGRFSMKPNEKDWINRMLGARQAVVDGRPLYAYRLKNTEYQELKNILAERCQSCMFLDDLLDDYGFRILFVFFATEWYKREYVGGPWRWEDIFGKFTSKAIKNVNKRSEAVKEGLRSLKINISDDADGKKYFGAIITNGGLPAKYIQANNNTNTGIVGLLTTALKYTIKYVINDDDLYEFIESRAPSQNFPASLQNENMYQLIIEVVRKIIDLKSRYNLNSRSGAIQKLDAANPTWREEFPILLEDDAIVSLLNRLIQEASETKVAQKQPFITHFLNGDNDSLFFDAKITFPNKPVDRDYFTRYFSAGDDLPDVFYFVARDADKTKIAKVELDLFKADTYIITPYDTPIHPTNSLILEVYDRDGQPVKCAKLRLSEEIDTTAPFVFTKNESGRYIYRGSGTVSVQENTCYIGISDSQLFTNNSLPAVNKFSINEQQITIFECTEPQITIGNDEITLNATQASRQYVLGGRLLGYKTKPYDAYLGIPQLYFIDEEHNYIKEQNVIYRKHKSDEILDMSDVAGLVDVCPVKNGRILAKIPVFVLPQDFRVEYDNLTESGGQVTITPDEHEIVVHRSASYNCLQSDNTLKLSSNKALPPSKFYVDLMFQDGFGKLNLELPFPAKGFGFYEESDNCINGETLSLQRIYGKSIKIFGMKDEILLSIRSGDITLTKNLVSTDNFSEHRLIDYEHDLRFLFNENDGDISLKLSDTHGHQSHLFISKYDSEISVTAEKQLAIIPRKGLKATDFHLIAVNLLDINAPVINLSLVNECFIDTTILNGQGDLYLICSDKTSTFVCKPFVFRQAANAQIGDFYKYIVWNADAELTDLLVKSAVHDYSSEIWTNITSLMNIFDKNNLPLDSINLWKCISKNPSVLCAFILRAGFVSPDSLVEKKILEEPDIIRLILNAMDQRTTKFLHKIRNELMANAVQILRRDLITAVDEYKNYIFKSFDEYFSEYIQATQQAELREFVRRNYACAIDFIKQDMWLRHYKNIANVFFEISYELIVAMYDSPDILKKIENVKFLNSRLDGTALQDNVNKWANVNEPDDLSTFLFRDLSKLLNPFLNQATIIIPFDKILAKCGPKCMNECMCNPSFGNYNKYLFNANLGPQKNLVQFPILCAFLAHCGSDDTCLSDPDLTLAIKNYINFHAKYFTESYRIATIIMSKI